MSLTMLFITFTLIYASLSENKNMWQNFVNTDPTMSVIVMGEQSSREYRLFPALKRNLGGHFVKDNP